jgi:hypothetical protein
LAGGHNIADRSLAADSNIVGGRTEASLSPPAEEESSTTWAGRATTCRAEETHTMQLQLQLQNEDEDENEKTLLLYWPDANLYYANP